MGTVALQAVDMVSAPCCDSAKGLSTGFVSSGLSHYSYWRRRGQTVFSSWSFHQVNRWRSLGIAALSHSPEVGSCPSALQVWWSQYCKADTAMSHGLPNVVPAQHHAQVSPAQVPMGETPWMWSLSRALLSRHSLTVIAFPRGDWADSRSEFSYNIWDGQCFCSESHWAVLLYGWEDATAGSQPRAAVQRISCSCHGASMEVTLFSGVSKSPPCHSHSYSMLQGLSFAQEMLKAVT